MSDTGLDEERFNLEVRKFLKKVGITSQREIELAVREAIKTRRLTGKETLQAHVTLELKPLGLRVNIDDDIKLS